MNRNKTVLQIFGRCILCFALVILIILIIFFREHYAPFGNLSLASSDANIQYLDLYSYFKDVLKGSNSIFYSFGKSLGGPMIAVFSYYLASPLSMLVYFFPKWEMHSFFNLLVMLKLGLAAASMSLFMQCRLKTYLKSNVHSVIICLLSVCYALSQYCIAQSSNVMWLEGVYFLPLMMLGVSRVVKGKNPAFLAVVTGFSVLFNWYSGLINCIMSFIWFGFEMILEQTCAGRKAAPEIVRIAVRYAAAMLIGICLSACLLLPTVGALQNSTRGSLDIKNLMDLSFNGNVLSAVEGYALGAKSSLGMVSLFCGGMTIVNCIVFFLSKRVPSGKKIVFGSFFMLMLLVYYWNPLFIVFSLLKDVFSYWYRYSYVTIFFIIFMGAYSSILYGAGEPARTYMKAAGLFSFLLLLISYAGHHNLLTYVYDTVIYTMLIGFCLYKMAEYQSKGADFPKRWAICLTLIVLAECYHGAELQMKNYRTNDVAVFRSYTAAQRRQINAIKAEDESVYRITQTSTRNMRDSNLTANYNEGLAYNYMPITSYTSSPDDAQRSFLNKAGYRMLTNNISVVNTSIIGTDSLLGVKYILSGYPIRGYELSDMEASNEKNVYLNPFALPFAFRYNGTAEAIESTGDPFRFQNALYSRLAGESIELYIPLQFKQTESSDHVVSYSLELPEGNYAFYGNLPCRSDFDGKVTINDSWGTEYAKLLSPTVFYIPAEAEDDTARITVTSKNKVDLKFGGEQFYALDLDLLRSVTDRLKIGAAENIQISREKAHFLVNAEQGESLFISIPYDRGWKITNNGRELTPDLIGGSLISIQLFEGTNEIEMEYHAPYLKEGSLISIGSLLALTALAVFFRKRTFFVQE